jgi:hypothetical protein
MTTKVKTAEELIKGIDFPLLKEQKKHYLNSLKILIMYQYLKNLKALSA